MTEDGVLREIADSCNLSLGSYQHMTHDEIYDILKECWYLMVMLLFMSLGVGLQALLSQRHKA